MIMSSIINEKWPDILSYMKDEFDISDVSYRTWLEPISIFKVTDEKLYIMVPDEFFRNYMTTQCTYFAS